ncbi:hypothetical protein Ancab_023032, partial [Ancistrocladus abbreviatus]
FLHTELWFGLKLCLSSDARVPPVQILCQLLFRSSGIWFCNSVVGLLEKADGRSEPDAMLNVCKLHFWNVSEMNYGSLLQGTLTQWKNVHYEDQRIWLLVRKTLQHLQSFRD